MCQECQSHGRPCGPKVFSGQQPQGPPQPPVATTTEEAPSASAWPRDSPWLPKIVEHTCASLDKVILKLKDEISKYESQSHPAPQAVEPEEPNGWPDLSPQVQAWAGFNVTNEATTFRDIYNASQPVDYSNHIFNTDFFSAGGFAFEAPNAQSEYRNAIPILHPGPSLPTSVTIDPRDLQRSEVIHICRIRSS